MGSWLLDLRSQVRRILPLANGGTANDQGAAGFLVRRMLVRLVEDVDPGMVVKLSGFDRCVVVDDDTDTDTIGVVLGKWLDNGRITPETATQFDAVAVVVGGITRVLLDEAVEVGEFAFPTDTPGAARGETAGATGTFGQFVSMGAAGGYAYVKIGGGGGGGGSSPLTTKGDLYGYDTADARVPVGSNGQLLKADSTDAQGVSWFTPFLPTGIAAKGDIVVGTANDTPAVLTVGTNGTLLSARSGATEGVAWEALKAEFDVVFTSPSAGQESVPFRVPYNCTIKAWYVTGNAAGSIVLDVWRDVFANYPPAVADSIVGAGTKPVLSTQRTNSATPPASWTSLALLEGDWLTVKVDSTSGLTTARLTLTVERA